MKSSMEIIIYEVLYKLLEWLASFNLKFSSLRLVYHYDRSIHGSFPLEDDLVTRSGVVCL